MNSIKLISLDLDGTLFDGEKQISLENQKAIREAREKGIEVIIATGRAYKGLPIQLFQDLGIRYAITMNGAGVFRLSDGECIYEDSMDTKLACPLLRKLAQYPSHLTSFQKNISYTEKKYEDLLDKTGLPKNLIKYIKETQVFCDDIAGYLEKTGEPVFKITINFLRLPDGTYQHYDTIRKMIEEDPRFDQVCGGGHNMEITKAGVSKGKALIWLAGQLGIPLEQTMACGDTENDVEIIRTAGIGVAMANAEDTAKNAADFITKSNEENGVAFAIRRFCGLEEDRLEKQFAFIREIDKEKQIGRQTYLADGQRKENDAEHAWHIAIMTVLLGEYANEKIDILKTVTMLLLHDIVEIDAGDTYAYDEEGKKTQRAREEAAADRIFGLLPKDQEEKFRALWEEFEAYETPEARFAHAMDNIQPAMLNDASDGISWMEHGTRLSQVLGRNAKTSLGSETLWNYAFEHFIRPNVEAGKIEDDTRK